MDLTNALHWDTALLDWLNSHHVPGSVPFLQFISDAATWFSISGVVLVLILSWLTKSRIMFRNFLIMALALILTAIMIQMLKALFDRERPFYTFPFIEKLSSGGGSSFPSGHTMEAFAMAAAAGLLFRKIWLVVPVMLWALLVAYSRVALGVHYPSDVIGGMIIGTGIGWLVTRVVIRYYPSGHGLGAGEY